MRDNSTVHRPATATTAASDATAPNSSKSSTYSNTDVTKSRQAATKQKEPGNRNTKTDRQTGGHMDRHYCKSSRRNEVKCIS